MKLFDSIQRIIVALRNEALNSYEYCTSGVWNDTKSNWWIDIIKTVNLSIRSFLDKNLQLKACGLTYYTLLAIVPALALIFAIGKGFGFQNLLQTELFKYFPAQSKALETAFRFVDSYLTQSSTGIFVGIGIIFLMWTLISLMSSVEDAFNHIWGIKKGRSFYRKLTDYTAIFLILPILIICASGISIFMSASSANNSFLSPIVSTILDTAPYILTWLFFTGTFMLIPYTKVKFKYALIAGILCGTAFQLLQWLFVTGQVYVSKYNAIYGSFAFLPLLLIWLQLTWLICLSGVVLTYSSQNIFRFNFQDTINGISPKYFDLVTIIIMTVIVKRFSADEKPYSKSEISRNYDIPIRLVGTIVDRLVEAGLVSIVIFETDDSTLAYQPAEDIQHISIGYALNKINSSGQSNFIPNLGSRFKETIVNYNSIYDRITDTKNDILLKNMHIESILKEK